MKTDIESLQGAWTISTLEMDGRKFGGSALNGASIVVKGTRFTTTGMGATYEGEMEIDPGKTPKEFDLKFVSGPEKGNTSHGIYKLDGDIWTLCLTTRGGARPTMFSAEPGTGIALETLTRAADSPASSGESLNREATDASSKRPAQPATNPVATTNPAVITELEGEWSMVSGTIDGQTMDPNGVKYGKRITHGSETSVLFGPQVYFKATVTADPSHTPRTIDYTFTQGPNTGKVQHGIYELSGTTATICMGAAGADRPTDFSTKPGDGKTLTVWKLDK